MLHYADNDTQIVIVSFYTLGWIQNLITTCWKLLPGKSILVIDNNPDKGEEGYRTDKEYANRNPMVDAERYWLNLHKNITVIKQPNRQNLTHGHGMDLAKRWCLEHGISNMTHIEPDCLFNDTKWYEEQMIAIKQGMIVAGCIRVVWGTTKVHKQINELPEAERQKIVQKNPIHPCCTTYHLPPLEGFSFEVQKRTQDALHHRYNELVTPYYNMHSNGELYWDTGHKIWFEAAKIDKSRQTNTHGLRHDWDSSMKDFWTRTQITL